MRKEESISESFITRDYLFDAGGTGEDEMSDIATRIYDGQYAEAELSDSLQHLGELNYHSNTFDSYDDSVEFKDCAPDMRLSGGHLDRLRFCGFLRTWLCHSDGSETYYYIGDDKAWHESRKEPKP